MVIEAKYVADKFAAGKTSVKNYDYVRTILPGIHTIISALALKLLANRT